MKSGDVPSPAAQPAPPLHPAGEVAQLGRRLRIIQATVLALFVALVAGLGYWQVNRSEELVAAGQRQILRRQIVPAPRGAIYDRDHRVLAENRPRVAAVVNLGMLRSEVQQEREMLLQQDKVSNRRAAGYASHVSKRARSAVVHRHLDRINTLTGRQVSLDTAALERHYANDRAAPFVLVDDLTAIEIGRLTEKLSPSDSIRIIRSLVRAYPKGNAAAHVVGRLRRDRTRHPDGPTFATLNVMDAWGDSGIEKHYDSRLQGLPGDAIVKIDAAGFIVGPPLETREPSPGQDVTLSIDLDLQRVAEQMMAATAGGRPRGAAVAVAVTTGEVLVMASKPDFDLNTVSPRISAATKQRIDAEGGWLNRATQALYPPGSSFKIFTALAGLRQGTLPPDAAFHCHGYHEVGVHRFVCHASEGHGEVTLRTGLAQSCNVFAYHAGLAAGPEALAAEARRFHLDQPTRIDLPSESDSMLVPDPLWKLADGRGAWTTGDTINLSIGQGFLRYSPLQAACAMASLARRETLTVPTLLRAPGRRPSGNRAAEPLGLNDRDYAALIEGLEAGVQIGISVNAHLPGVRMAGKSGTAQVLRENGMMNVAWFVAFAPIEQPEIAIAVALEGSEPGVEFAGAAHAAPIVREIAGAYFDKRRK